MLIFPSTILQQANVCHSDQHKISLTYARACTYVYICAPRSLNTTEDTIN